jgi:hypothetical protein
LSCWQVVTAHAQDCGVEATKPFLVVALGILSEGLNRFTSDRPLQTWFPHKGEYLSENLRRGLVVLTRDYRNASTLLASLKF